MKIEHMRAQLGGTDERQLDWDNLLGACLGEQGSPPDEQCCDTRKGARALDVRLFPTSASISSLLRTGHPMNVGLARASRRRPDCPLPLLILCPMVRGRARPTAHHLAGNRIWARQPWYS